MTTEATTTTNTSDAADAAKAKLMQAIHDVRPALTDTEAYFLHALLIDPPQQLSNDDQRTTEHGSDNQNTTSQHRRLEQITRATKRLSDDMLFSSMLPDMSSMAQLKTPQQQAPPKPQRPSILGLWKAFHDGVTPRNLIRKLSSDGLPRTASHGDSGQGDDVTNMPVDDGDHNSTISTNDNNKKTAAAISEEVDNWSIPSDEEIRPDDADNELSDLSWDDDNEDDLHFDAWDVLKDEYAADFGFGFDPKGLSPTSVDDNDDDDQNVFLILGTSAEDASCQPHVLSPPLLDSLMSFVPMQLHNENYWLKFSLVRDGASLQTLKQYTRAATYTILAVETTQGHVFGSFTSSPWRNGCGFYGGPPAFVWKMRHGRRTKVASLFDQAQLESEIDVFMFLADSGASSSDNETDDHALTEPGVQVCRHDFLAVGGDKGLYEKRGRDDDDSLVSGPSPKETMVDRSGFALTLDADLSTGTTSPCKTFKSPALCGKGNVTRTFLVAGLEVWTFTPARNVSDAEKLEMTKFFIEQSSRNVSEVDGSSSRSMSSYNPINFSSRDLIQQEFYRRLGDEAEPLT